ncbi:CapA family protein [Pectobacterium parmentieri]|nr:CapA family protein [Pectobacterium parmentieri]AYH00362.1 capsule biosynthesis protein CapA [Pectobacterium parmentieri]AYH26599.1 capsule biosynthesis protein CapA [Pectobacterium parmentieri]AYH31047.1 capsule biosynthesis protein CapA [Pectobacterium parmentieri]MBI0517771.1 CapA family protein [Pectobacterium parmentieri]MBI0550222.1 CapA family protein [Pectobacterium parmentieri]
MRIIACGDLLFSSRNLAARVDKNIVDQLAAADAVFANAEFCCPKPTTPPAAGRGYITAVRQATLDEFVDLNIKLVSFANNHTGDFGWEGVVDTIDAAEERGLIHCGVGRNLDDARAARFLDTPKGRVGVVAVSSTRSEVFAASVAGGSVVARPGLNPLRWGRAYVLPDKEFEQLQEITELLGVAASNREGARIEVMADQGPDRFKFGSLFESSIPIERGEQAYVRTFMNEEDCAAILKSVRDAANRSDVAIVSLHTHEGEGDGWYAPHPPEFIEDFAHRAIDAGASAVVGHGAHFLRGVEIYNKRPIFYNLGSLLMEFEAGESIIAPEMYTAYGYDHDARPSDLHRARAKDREGNFIGFNAESRFSKNCAALLDYADGALQFKLLPLDLGMNRERPLDRGLPVTVSAALGHEIAADLTRMSARYGTVLRYDEELGTIAIEKA